MKRKVIIEMEFGSDFQKDCYTDLFNLIIMKVFVPQFLNSHQKNKIEVKDELDKHNTLD